MSEYRSLPDSYSLAEFVRRYELGVYETAKAHEQTYVLDLAAAFERTGKQDALEWRELPLPASLSPIYYLVRPLRLVAKYVRPRGSDGRRD